MMTSDTSFANMIDCLKKSLAAAFRTPEGVEAPAALLWTDAESQWQPIISALRAEMTYVYTLGPYEPAENRGPAIWLRCIVDRTLPNVAPPVGTAPVIYLPGVSRQDLRAGADCPAHLMPLVELQYRGSLWHHKNGRDWSVMAFLISEDGLGLDVAQDMRTQEAMLRALPQLAKEPLEHLRGHRLEAEDFDRLTVGDPVHDILGWMNDERTFRGNCNDARWEAFRSVCTGQFGFDPDVHGISHAAEALVYETGKWDHVWQRFSEAPRLYPGMVRALRDVYPRQGLFDFSSRRPEANASAEEQLRTKLSEIAQQPPQDACDNILRLEQEHGSRRSWVWAQLGESPLAVVLEPLSRLAKNARSPLGGSNVAAISADYASHGWLCDKAAVDAIAVAKSADADIIYNVIAAVYTPWLDRSARRFQELIVADERAFRKLIKPVDAERETCILFVDGLRYDIAGSLQAVLESRGMQVKLGHRIVPPPTVTATTKPLASPVHGGCVGDNTSGEDFTPLLATKKQPATTARIRDELMSQGVQVFMFPEIGSPANAKNGGWTEIGSIDEIGHKMQLRLAGHLADEIETIADRVEALLTVGWQYVRLVTDHGWLLVPGGLPKVDLPKYLTATRWTRCTVLKGEAKPEMPVVPWYWNQQVMIASAPGIHAFFTNVEYAHGGISPQECVVPDMTVSFGTKTANAKIVDVQWRGMRCRIKVETNVEGLSVDLRFHTKQAGTSIAHALKQLDQNGEASLAVEDDKYEGAAAVVVVIDKSGQVLVSRPTQIGE
ncbi:MAG: BREX-1 system phosphatase PglZ type B [Nitrospirae bacterium]|nr:BREX-1 system phosphatase PglZ type B [Nitrospirota bacterium]